MVWWKHLVLSVWWTQHHACSVQLSGWARNLGWSDILVVNKSLFFHFKSLSLVIFPCISMLISFGILWLSGPRLFVWVTERSPTVSSNPTVVFRCSVLSHKWSLPDQRELQSSPDLRKGNCFRVSFGRVCSKRCILIWYQYAPLMTIRFTNERKNLISITALVWQCSINLMYFNSASFLFKKFLLTST